MKKIKIETLTPVHIGSGRDLSANTEFLVFPYKDEDGDNAAYLAVIDEEKVLDIIGNENVDQWVGIINRNEALLPYLQKRRPNLTPSHIAKRKATFYGENPSGKTLKEQLHDGRAIPYIPGSSIKGAIRTAITAHYAKQNSEIAKRNLKGKKGFSGQEFEKRMFGSNPNEDVFRFLQIGDVFFNFETIAVKAEIFNMFHHGWNFKHGGSHLVEAIPEGAETEFNLKINHALLEKNNPKAKTDFLKSNSELFKIIQSHTLGLLKQEIEFLDELKTNENGFLEYLDWLKDILADASDYNTNEALLRIGFGSGWKYITGGWATEVMSELDYEQFLKTVRRKNYDSDVPFPKSRKVGESGDMFGFVKLIMEE